MHIGKRLVRALCLALCLTWLLAGVALASGRHQMEYTRSDGVLSYTHTCEYEDFDNYRAYYAPYGDLTITITHYYPDDWDSDGEWAVSFPYDGGREVSAECATFIAVVDAMTECHDLVYAREYDEYTGPIPSYDQKDFGDYTEYYFSQNGFSATLINERYYENDFDGTSGWEVGFLGDGFQVKPAEDRWRFIDVQGIADTVRAIVELEDPGAASVDAAALLWDTGELGDDSVPLPALCAAAALTVSTAVYADRRRRRC